MDEDRRINPGRRESDVALDALYRELDRVWRELEGLEKALEVVRTHFHARVSELAQHDIVERTKVGERTQEEVERVRRIDRRWNRLAVFIALISTTAAILEPFFLH